MSENYPQKQKENQNTFKSSFYMTSNIAKHPKKYAIKDIVQYQPMCQQHTSWLSGYA